MELFKNTNFDFLGKKWPFIYLSLALTAAGLISLAIKGGPRYGIDFRGGTLMYVRFADRPDVEKIRKALSARTQIDVVQEIFGTPEVMVGTDMRDERQLDQARRTIVQTLAETFGQPQAGKIDINNSGTQTIADMLGGALQRAGFGMPDAQVQGVAKAITGYRDTPPRSGLVRNIDELAQVPGVTQPVVNALKQSFYASPYTIRNVEIVGPKIGAELQQKALLATLYALGGMLVYIAFRFEWIYGLAAVIAVFHDTIITIGLFSIFNKEISLTVVAALLTLVGYSMNDTIVVFDRIRENLKILRREKLEGLINISVNQTLSRTVLTSGLTLLTALALWFFGGQVLNGFSFCLVCGIIVGTYSSIFVASPILVFWQDFVERRKRAAAVSVPAARESLKRSAPKTAK